MQINLKEITPQYGEWTIASYPGDGAYLTPNGIFFVMDGCLFGFNSGNWRRVVSEDSKSIGIDVHKLFDQMITLTRTDSAKPR